jgi:hypothetical protein
VLTGCGRRPGQHSADGIGPGELPAEAPGPAGASASAQGPRQVAASLLYVPSEFLQKAAQITRQLGPRRNMARQEVGTSRRRYQFIGQIVVVL